MPDPTLHGNGDNCEACALQREESQATRTFYRTGFQCNRCGGTGRIPRDTARIVADHVEEARKHYWPTRGLD